jgi:branched-chain amino acid transport system substrate-binding protein
LQQADKWQMQHLCGRNCDRAVTRNEVRETEPMGILSKLASAAVAIVVASSSAHAQKDYDPGVSDTEIKIGNTAAYSGPAAAYGVAGFAWAAFFRMINDHGGINGRKVNFISYDDAYSSPKTVEQVRKLVESDEVFMVVEPLGTASNAAIQKYMNVKKVPHVFIGSNSSKWSDPQNFPYSIGFGTTYRTEAMIYAQYILDTKPDAKVGILYQNDDMGKEYLNGMKEGLGDKAKTMLVAEISYETTSPTVDSEIVRLKASGADVLFSAASPKFVAQEIRKVVELGWKPLHVVSITGSYIAASIKPAGFENAQGIISSSYWKDPLDSQWANDPAMNEWRSFMTKYYPEGDKGNTLNTDAYLRGKILVDVLKRAGDNLTRDNVMALLRNMKDVKSGLLLPGIMVNTGPNRPTPLSQTQLMRLKGEQWELFGPIIESASEGGK